MHIYSAQLTAAPGKIRQAREATALLRDVAVAAHGIPTSAWAVAAGASFGTYAIAARVEGTEQLLEGMAALEASDGWNAVSEEFADLFTGSVETIYSQAIVATNDGLDPKPLMSVTRAVVAPGHNKPAIEAAVSLLNYVSDKTDLDGVLTISMAGTMNELTWIFGLDSGAQGDAALATLGADPGWAALEEAAGPHFQASGQRMLLARLP